MTSAADPRGRAIWLYCLTDERRRVVKVGISGNVKTRAVSVCPQGVNFIRRWCGLVVSARAPFPVVRTWNLGGRSRAEAMAVEAVAHAALRDLATTFSGEWFHVSPRIAVAIIESACRGYFQEAA